MDRIEKALKNVIEELTGILEKRTIERIRVNASEDSYNDGERSITVTVEYLPKEDEDESSADNEITETIKSHDGEVIDRKKC